MALSFIGFELGMLFSQPQTLWVIEGLQGHLCQEVLSVHTDADLGALLSQVRGHPCHTESLAQRGAEPGTGDPANRRSVQHDRVAVLLGAFVRQS